MGVAVKRFGCIDCDERCHRLSVFSMEDLSVQEEFELPFDKDEAVACRSSCGLLYFVGSKGKIVICSLSTNQMKVLPLPIFKSHPHMGVLRACCMGFDATVQDYKVIRYCVQYYREEIDKGEIRYADARSYYEVYSFKRGSWEEIPNHVPSISAAICEGMGVFIEKTGCCYWTALHEYSPGDVQTNNAVLSFDFGSEKFNYFLLPEPSKKKVHFSYTLVDCSGALGALVFWNECSFRPSSPMSLELYIWNGTVWDMSHAATLSRVNKPIGLVNGEVLALEAKYSSKVGQLMLYNLRTEEMKMLNVYDTPSMMSLHDCLPNHDVTLPESVPMHFRPYDESTDPKPVVDWLVERELEDKEEKKIKKFLKEKAEAKKQRAEAKKQRAEAKAKRAEAKAKKARLRARAIAMRQKWAEARANAKTEEEMKIVTSLEAEAKARIRARRKANKEKWAEAKVNAKRAKAKARKRTKTASEDTGGARKRTKAATEDRA